MMMLDGTDADGEWSDEEVVRSGSNTGVSETEADDHQPIVTIPRPQSSLGAMTSRSPYSFMSSDSLGHHHSSNNDPVVSILDRIDAEIEMIGQTPSLPSPPQKNGKHRNGSSLRSQSPYRIGHSTSPSSFLLNTPDNPEDTDTGLGLASFRGDEGSNPDKINGAAEIYSEAGMTDGQTDDDGFRRVSDAPSDLDSVAAQQIDTKFKEIMRKKKDDPEDSESTRHRPRRRTPQHGQSRVHFYTPPPQFRDGGNPSSLPPDLPIHPGKRASSLTLTPRLRQNRTRQSATMLSTGYGTDNDSIRTEDFESKFTNLLVTSDTEKQPEIAPAPKQGILSNSTRKKEFAEVIPKPNGTDTQLKSRYSSEPALNSTNPEGDDILQRLMSIANSPSPSSANRAPSPHHHVSQGSSSPRPRSLSPSRLRLRKQHTSGDITSLWKSSASSSSLKTTWDESFWASAKNNSRRSPSVQSSSSNFDEVESLNFSSKSSNDSHPLFYERGVAGSRKGGTVGGGGGRFLGKDSGFCTGGGVDGGWGGGGEGGGYRGNGINEDLQPQRYLSRQSSTTSTSTSPSSGNVGSSEASQSSAKDMALAKTLVDFLESFGNQGNLGPADKVSLQKLTRQVVEWESKNSGCSGRSSGGEASSGARSKSNKDTYSTWSETGSLASASGLRLDECRHREEHVNGSSGNKQNSFLNHFDNTSNSKTKRRRDLIIPDDEESIQTNRDYDRNVKSEIRKFKGETGSTLMKSIRKGEGKETTIHEPHKGGFSQDKMQREPISHSGRRTLFPGRSFNKSASFDSNASPVDGYNSMVHPLSANHAERVLMGLGFGGREGFLPERFLRDWYSKLSVTQDNQQPWESDGRTEEKENHPVKNNTLKEYTQNQGDKKGFDTNRDQNRPIRQDSITSSQLDESSNFPPRGNGQDGKNRQITEFLSALSSNANSDEVSNRDSRINHFANSRQISLPLYLETLSEEDEKSTRVPGVDPFDKEAKLQMFITDVMSSSGKSTGSVSENSLPSSNMSECDTQSSSSDCQNLAALRNSDIYKTRAEKYREHQRLATKAMKEPPNRAQGLENTQTKAFQKPISKPSTKSNRGAKLVRQDKKELEPNDNRNGPSEREVRFSTDSLEVADIMRDDKGVSDNHKTPNDAIDTAKSRNQMLKTIEPAMVSIVLEDVDEGKSGFNNRPELSRTESGRLSVPSSGSSMSLSPIPQSPVTVIEVGLDNTQDSLDTEDGSTPLRDIENYSPQNIRSAGSSPATVSCENCGKAVFGKKKRRVFDADSTKDPNGAEDDASSCRSDLHTYHRDRKGQRNCSDISKEHATANWINSSDESSCEQSRHQRETRLGVHRSPNSFSKRRLHHSARLSPSQSPSHYRRNKEVHSDSCHRHCPNSASSQCTSLSPSPVSAYYENSQRKGWVQKACAQDDECHALHCHSKCAHHYHRDSIHCGLPHAGYQHHHHHHPYQYHSECCLHNRHSLHQSPKYDPSLHISDCCTNASSISVSAHSSPGSLKSAFRSPRKDNDTFSSPRDELLGRSEISETDQDEIPSNMTICLNQRPISANRNGMLAHPGSPHNDSTVINILDSLDHHQSPLLFSDVSCSHPDQAKISNGKVHQISRAVQACLPNTSDRFVHNSSSGNYYLACDREVQCSLGENDKSSSICFDKYVQTRIPHCEVSCQTIDEASSVGQPQRHEHHHADCLISKSVNTVISLIGDEHNVNTHDTRLADHHSKPVESTKCHEFQLVDDTLDLIEMELVAMENKSRKNDKLDSSLRLALQNTSHYLPTSPSPSYSNPSQIQSVVPHNCESLTNPFVSNVSTQPSPLLPQSMATNPFLNIETNTNPDSQSDEIGFEGTMETIQQTQNFDIEKEMAAYLRPCQGMYDGVSPPESFRSSPCDRNTSPFLKPIPTTDGMSHVDIRYENRDEPNEQRSLQELVDRVSGGDTNTEDTIFCSKEKQPVETQAVKSTAKKGKNPLVKGKSTPIISVVDFQKDFLQIPLSPHERTCKARYPSFNMSSPTSSKSAPPSAMTSPPGNTHFSVPLRSYSLSNIPVSFNTEINVENEHDNLQKHVHPTKFESDVKSALSKVESMELNSDISEIPLSSSKDSFTEVSVLSSMDGPAQLQYLQQSMQISISSDSTHVDEVSLESLHLPEGVEFSLSCPHSNWEGMYGNKKLRTSRIDKLLRAQTDGPDRHLLSLYSMDALSDKSIAGSEMAQDIEDIDILLSQKASLRHDSDSSYSDIENDAVDALSEASTCSSINDEGNTANKHLGVLDDQCDLLQVSDCGEMTPSQSRMSPSCVENLDAGENETFSNPTVCSLIENIKNKDKINHQCIENMFLPINEDITAENVVIDPLYIEAPSVSNCSDVNLHQLPSPDYDIAPSTLFDEYDSQDSITASEEQLKDFEEVDNELITMRSHPVDETHMTLTSDGEMGDNVDRIDNTVESRKQNLLRTFQTAEFDSLLNKTVSGEDSALQLESGIQHFDTSPLFKTDTTQNVHVLSVETEDRLDNNGKEIGCSIDECNIMDELEIIALFKNMEDLNDRDNIDYTPNMCSPYPLSEIPEEETQSEESLTIDHGVCNEPSRIVKAQETQESVIEDTGIIGVNRDTTNYSDDGFVECVNDAISVSGRDDLGIQNSDSEFETTENSRNEEVENFHNSKLSTPSKNVTELEKTTIKEERTFSSGLVYYCKHKSQTTQKTTLNFDSPKNSTQSTNDDADSNDGGHLSTMSLTVRDYRSTTPNNETEDKIPATLGELNDNDESKTKSPRRQLVKTMYSQSFSDEYPYVFTSAKNNNAAQWNRVNAETAAVTTGKRLRSRESLLRLHEQKKCTGSDSDSETPQENLEDVESKSSDADSNKPTLTSPDEDEEKDKMFVNFLTYDDTSFNPRRDSFSNGYSGYKTSTQTAPLSITRGVIFSENDPRSVKVKDTKANPRVIVQQPSDDIPYWDTMAWRKAAASPPPSYEEANANDNHLHPNRAFGEDNKTDGGKNQPSPNRLNQSTSKTGLWTRRTNQSNLLSPSLALLNNTFKEPASLFRRDYASSADDSHPELDYLDLIPKFNGGNSKESQPSNNRLSLPVQKMGVDRSSNQTKLEIRPDSETSGKCNGTSTKDDEKYDGASIKEDKPFPKIEPLIIFDIEEEPKSNFVYSEINSPKIIEENKVENCVECGKAHDIFENFCQKTNPEILSNEEIDQFLKPEVYDNGKRSDSFSTKRLRTTSDSVDSSDSKFMSVVSRDSGFESRGSPIEQSALKGSQPKNVLFLSGVEFSDEQL